MVHESRGIVLGPSKIASRFQRTFSVRALCWSDRFEGIDSILRLRQIDRYSSRGKPKSPVRIRVVSSARKFFKAAKLPSSSIAALRTSVRTFVNGTASPWFTLAGGKANRDIEGFGMQTVQFNEAEWRPPNSTIWSADLDIGRFGVQTIRCNA